ncbi:hypothetical protein TCAL_06053 [Tigriopus californicus]|uniref:Protein kinase domain-containing protein n=1 Tax=Tigriopus californicus TaxID=6832 RepID=A0A553PNQ8_TIGCA|nr:serine/threonine-protein kinase pelle-like [Tigriopus californicus]TRY79309.1 hypothetical protein TCAL_06053 [Tigriopus californicus]|eukprot:TCALIF_06053-PA protein Name:"Similar to pll Serine/threonine-protein kinase pelle (Drosophila melanogaster)" AED:0.06 eAED:0.06 QI:0/-1/0/1/-1/1/1/0/684
MFLYDLPYVLQRALVDVLDQNDNWEELGGLIWQLQPSLLAKFSQARYRPGESPAKALMAFAGHNNKTVLEMYQDLHRLRLFQAMDLLLDHIPTDCRIPSRLPPAGHGDGWREGGGWDLGRPRPVPPPCLSGRECRHLEDNLNQTHPRPEGVKLVPKSGLSLPPGSSQPWPNGPAPNQQDYLSQGPDRCRPSASGVGLVSTSENQIDQPPSPPSPLGPAGPAPALGASQNSLAELPHLSPLTHRSSSGVPIGDSEFMLKNIKFQDLEQACQGFRREPGILIGRGGFGEVFRGRWNGQDVAVKRILEEKRKLIGDAAFQKCVNQAITELQTLHIYPAENILPLLAYSFSRQSPTDPCLVYQYMPNGSVSDRLKCRDGTLPLTWKQRANVALGTARGLIHLHANNIIHGDIKSGNILLDRHFEPKIGDFGLARSGSETEDVSFKMVSAVKGTEAYLPEDYIRSHELTPAVDTFCYGIFMFELVTAKSPSFLIDRTRNMRMREALLGSEQPDQWLDPNLERNCWANILFYMGLDCAKKSRRARPPMTEVLKALESLYGHQSSAMALQIYYDETKLKGNDREIDQFSKIINSSHLIAATSEMVTTDETVPNHHDYIPAVLDLVDPENSSTHATETTSTTDISLPLEGTEDNNALSTLANDDLVEENQLVLPDFSALNIEPSNHVPPPND